MRRRRPVAQRQRQAGCPMRAACNAWTAHFSGTEVLHAGVPQLAAQEEADALRFLKNRGDSVAQHAHRKPRSRATDP
jgi:hypothetical protein